MNDIPKIDVSENDISSFAATETPEVPDINAQERMLEEAYREKAAKRRHRFRLAVLSVGLFFLALLIISTIVVFAGFRIKKVELTGLGDFYSKKDVLGAAGIEMGDNLLFVKPDSAEKKILENLPYVDSVEVTKKLHNTLVIKCEKAEAFYALEIESKSTYLILSENLRIIEEVGTPPAGSIVVNAAVPTVQDPGETISFVSSDDEKDVTADILMVLSDAITENGLKGITSADITDTNAITLVYNNSIILELGSSADADGKIALAVDVINSEKDINPDVRYSVDLSIEKKAYVKPLTEEEEETTADDEETDSEEKTDSEDEENENTSSKDEDEERDTSDEDSGDEN